MLRAGREAYGEWDSKVEEETILAARIYWAMEDARTRRSRVRDE